MNQIENVESCLLGPSAGRPKRSYSTAKFPVLLLSTDTLYFFCLFFSFAAARPQTRLYVPVLVSREFLAERLVIRSRIFKRAEEEREREREFPPLRNFGGFLQLLYVILLLPFSPDYFTQFIPVFIHLFLQLRKLKLLFCRLGESFVGSNWINYFSHFVMNEAKSF